MGDLRFITVRRYLGGVIAGTLGVALVDEESTFDVNAMPAVLAIYFNFEFVHRDMHGLAEDAYESRILTEEDGVVEFVGDGLPSVHVDLDGFTHVGLEEGKVTSCGLGCSPFGVRHC